MQYRQAILTTTSLAILRTRCRDAEQTGAEYILARSRGGNTRPLRKRLSGTPGLLLLMLWLVACAPEEEPVLLLNILGGTINGRTLTNGATQVDPEVRIDLTFSARLDPLRFERVLRLETESGDPVIPSITYAAGGSRAQISAQLSPAQSYRLTLNDEPIGAQGERLQAPASWRFTTMGSGIITEQAPCTSATSDCLEMVPVVGPQTLPVYGSFPLLAENRRWERLRYAVIAIHGQNRNAGDYFQYVTELLAQTGKSEDIILLAPRFAEMGSGNSLFWLDRGWRFGWSSDDGSMTSSFSAIDGLIDYLADRDRFPALEEILVTGHSSGAAFTQLYAFANRQDAQHPELSMSYVVANSQYFHYPVDLRWDPVQGAFVNPDPNDCPRFTSWPYGFSRLPDYVEGADRDSLNARFAARRVLYLLGTDDTVTTGSLNTRDCEAVLLGQHRYERGQLIHQLMDTYFSATEHHDRLDVPGVGHQARAMYQSMVFRDWFADQFP